MTLNDQKRISKHICRLLKVTEVNYPIGRTPKGNLSLIFSENTGDFELALDSIPLSTKSILEDENNIELKKLIEKYLFEQEQVAYFPAPLSTKATLELEPKSKGGRPKGAKNKVKHG